MKKILTVLLAVTMLLLCACGSNAPAATPAPTAAPETPVPTPVPTAAPTEEPTEPVEAEQPTTPEPAGDAFTFTTTDREGNIYTQEIFSDYRLIMVNFWEPWCGPCVREMPDIQALYDDYSDQGLLVLGVYSTPDVEDDVDAVLEMTCVNYPILLMSEDFYGFGTGFVPTTVFFDSEGHVLRHELDEDLLRMLGTGEHYAELAETVYVGSRDYAAWEAIVQEALS